VLLGLLGIERGVGGASDVMDVMWRMSMIGTVCGIVVVVVVDIVGFDSEVDEGGP
jgi:hypothetical protein